MTGLCNRTVFGSALSQCTRIIDDMRIYHRVHGSKNNETTHRGRCRMRQACVWPQMLTDGGLAGRETHKEKVKRRHWHGRRRSTMVKARNNSNEFDNASGGGFKGAERDLSRLEIEVPREQRPINELKELKNSVLYSWVRLLNA